MPVIDFQWQPSEWHRRCDESLKGREMEEINGKTSFVNDKRFIGHPLGLGVTSTCVLFQSFGNYGMSAILVYYLYKAVSEGGLGFSEINAAQFVSLYSSLTFMGGIIGGYMVDRYFGARKAIAFGYILKTLGYFLLAIPIGSAGLYLGSQAVLVLSSTMMGTSLYAMTGKLYEGDDRRDAGFSVMYIMNNIGAAAPVITGTIALVLNYHAGFLFAAVAQGLGLLLYLLTEKKVFGTAGLEPDDPTDPEKRTSGLVKIYGVILAFIAVAGVLLATGTVSPTVFCNTVSTVAIAVPIVYMLIIYNSKKVSREEAKKIIPFVFVFLGNCFNMMIWNQSTSIIAIYTAENVNMNFFGIELTPAAFQTVPAVYAVIFGSLSSLLWTKLKDKQPSTHTKFGLGTLFWGLGPLFMVIPFLLYPAGVKVSPLFLFVFYALIIWGEAFTSPTGMALASKVAPVAFTAQMIEVWNLSQSTGAGLSTLMANFYTEGNEVGYFLFIGSITCVVGLILCILRKKLTKMMD